jgi:hypothetical protein
MSSEKQENKHFSVYYQKKTPKNCVFFADQKLPIWKCVRGFGWVRSVFRVNYYYYIYYDPNVCILKK